MSTTRMWRAALVGRIVTASLRRVARTATLSITSLEPTLEAGNACAPFAERLLHDATKGHVIVPFWSAHQLTIALLAAERFGFGSVLKRFEVVADDSLGGEIMWYLGARFGLKMRTIHTRGNARRLEDVGAWLRNPAPFLIAVDGGGSYGTVSTGIVRLAARLGSVLWPLAVRSRPAVRCPGLVAEIPLPGAALSLAVAAPLRVGRNAPIVLAAEDLKMRLDAASDAAAALFEPACAARTSERPKRRQQSA